MIGPRRGAHGRGCGAQRAVWRASPARLPHDLAGRPVWVVTVLTRCFSPTATCIGTGSSYLSAGPCINTRAGCVRSAPVSPQPLDPSNPTANVDGLDDPRYLAAVVDLLGVVACSELVAFERLALDTALAPTISDKTQMAEMAAAEVRHVRQLRGRLVELGADPDSAMAPFVEPLADFHAKTAPGDWYESLVKAYVGDGIGADFYLEMAQWVDPTTRAVLLEVCQDTGHADFAVATVLEGVRLDPRLSGRLALWGRRLVGEAMQQAQRVAADRDALTALLLGQVGPAADGAGMDLAGLGEMFGRLTDAHTVRMQNLGMTA